MGDKWLEEAPPGQMVERPLRTLPQTNCAEPGVRIKYRLQILPVAQAAGQTINFCVVQCRLGSCCSHRNANKKCNHISVNKNLRPGQLVVCELYDGCQVSELDVLKALVRNLDCCLISLIGDSQFLALPLSLCPCRNHVSNCIWRRRRTNSATATTRLGDTGMMSTL
jgi:hypothetical protein